MPCSVPGIPNRLHRNGQGADNVFDESLIYIRLKPSDFVSPALISHNAFRIDMQSCNREKYSTDPRDVLLNINAATVSDHFLNYGIVSIPIDALRKGSFDHPTDTTKQYKLDLVHTPEECMFPHSEIVTFLASDANRQNVGISSSLVRAGIRQFYRRVLTVIQAPNNAEETIDRGIQ